MQYPGVSLRYNHAFTECWVTGVSNLDEGTARDVLINDLKAASQHLKSVSERCQRLGEEQKRLTDEYKKLTDERNKLTEECSELELGRDRRYNFMGLIAVDSAANLIRIVPRVRPTSATPLTPADSLHIDTSDSGLASTAARLIHEALPDRASKRSCPGELSERKKQKMDEIVPNIDTATANNTPDAATPSSDSHGHELRDCLTLLVSSLKEGRTVDVESLDRASQQAPGSHLSETFVLANAVGKLANTIPETRRWLAEELHKHSLHLPENDLDIPNVVNPFLRFALRFSPGAQPTAITATPAPPAPPAPLAPPATTSKIPTAVMVPTTTTTTTEANTTPAAVAGAARPQPSRSPIIIDDNNNDDDDNDDESVRQPPPDTKPVRTTSTSAPPHIEENPDDSSSDSNPSIADDNSDGSYHFEDDVDDDAMTTPSTATRPLYQRRRSRAKPTSSTRHAYAGSQVQNPSTSSAHGFFPEPLAPDEVHAHFNKQRATLDRRFNTILTQSFPAKAKVKKRAPPEPMWEANRLIYDQTQRLVRLSGYLQHKGNEALYERVIDEIRGRPFMSRIENGSDRKAIVDDLERLVDDLRAARPAAA